MTIRSGLLASTLIVSYFLFFCVGYLTYPLLHFEVGTQVNEPNVPVQTPAPLNDNGESTSLPLGIFWEAHHWLDKDFYGTKPDAKTMEYAATAAMVASFGDPYTVFVQPEAQQSQNEAIQGKYGGIGALIEKNEVGFFLNPIADQPADQAGIQGGDQLIQVDSVAITPQMNTDDVLNLVRGDVGTPVALTVQRTITASESPPPTLQQLTFQIVRVELELPSMQWRMLDDTAQTAQIGYIHHFIFSERSLQEMQKAVADLRSKGATRMILDLRGNRGGLVDAAKSVLDMWVGDGVALIEKFANGTEETYRTSDGGEAVDLPLVVLVDEGTASASEIVAGALQDRGRAQLVGQKTYGKGSVQLLRELSDKSSLHVTTAQWLTPNQHQISGQGLQPDIVIEPGVDPLPTAIEILLQTKAVSIETAKPIPVLDTNLLL